jgi:hypothetical protein
LAPRILVAPPLFLAKRRLPSACPQGVDCGLFVKNLLPLHYGLHFF